MRFEPLVEAIQHHARLYPNRRGFLVELADFGQVLTRIHHQAFADGLTGLGCASTAGCHRQTDLVRDLERTKHIGGGLRHDHPDRLDLVDGRVGGVEPSAE